MKRIPLTLLTLLAASAFAQTANYPTSTFLSCDGGALVVTRTDYTPGQVTQLLFHVSDPQIVAYLGGVLGEESTMRGLDPSDFKYAPNIEAPIAKGQFYASKDTLASVIADGQFPAIVAQGGAYRMQPGKGMPDFLVGKVQVTPTVKVAREGQGLKISVYREENLALGVPGIYLGDWYFQHCE